MTPTLTLWFHALGLLAVQVVIVVAAAAGLKPFLKSGKAMRATWLAAFTAIALLLTNALTGLDRPIFAAARSHPARQPQFVVRTDLTPEISTAVRPGTPPTEPGLMAYSAPGHPATRVWWPAWAWLAGVLVFGGLALGSRLLLIAISRRRFARADAEIHDRVAALAERLSFRRRVVVIESAALAGPIALGWFRPTIGLPCGFMAAHSPVEQDAMLAHELAHLKARDPQWLAMADAVTALLWWHPLVWWARHQLRTTSELAADESSLLLDNGPQVLAGCLVSLANRLEGRRSLGAIGMAGFRSGLGRRVERLLQFELGEAGVPARRVPWGVWLAGTAAVVGLALASTAGGMQLRGSATPALLPLLRQALSSRAEAAKPVAEHTAEAASPAPAPAQNPPPTTNQVSADALVRDGELLYAKGLLAEAKAKFEAALKQLPEKTRLSLNARKYLLEIQLKQKPKTTELLTRTYKIDPATFNRNVIGFRPPLDLGSEDQPLAEKLHRLFIAAGVSLDETVPASGSEDQGASQRNRPMMFYNDRNGMLFVRVNAAEIDLVDLIIQLLGFNPPQVMVEAKFVVITSDDGQMDDFGWLPLGSIPGVGMTNATTGLGSWPGSPSGPAHLTAGLRASADPASVWTIQELRGDEVLVPSWLGRDVPNAHNIRVVASTNTLLMGILTDSQFRLTLKALERLPGCDILTAPRVTTASGRQTQIKVADIPTILTGISPKALEQPDRSRTAKPEPFTKAMIECGPTLDVIPLVSDDGFTIDLSVVAALSEFLGYDEPAEPKTIQIWKSDGSKEWVKVPQPRFRLRQMSAKVQVWDGQTLVLGGGAVPADKQPGSKAQKRLLVFVTPVLIDPAGNRIHTAEDMPFAQNQVPAQSAR